MLKDLVFVVAWHSGDGDHVFASLNEAIAYVRRNPHRDASLHVVNWRSGERRVLTLDAVR